MIKMKMKNKKSSSENPKLLRVYFIIMMGEYWFCHRGKIVSKLSTNFTAADFAFVNKINVSILSCW